VIITILNTVAPVTVCAVIGLVWAKQGYQYETVFVTRLATYIGFPCLIFKTLVSINSDFDSLFLMGGLGLLTTGVFALAAIPALKFSKLSIRTFMPSLTFANTGNLGLSICLLAFGKEGLALAIGYFTVSSILVFLFGPAVAVGRFSPSAVLKSPLIWAVMLAALVIALDCSIPLWALNSLDLLGSFAIPLMLITLGVSLASLKVDNFRRGMWISILRLGLGFLIGWGTAEIFNLEGIARGVLIIECAMPAAVFNYVYAEMYATSPNEVAAVVMISTLLSFITMPGLLWFVVGS
tara:strand:- start:443 stop:1324 length:882 start_codon:yes stop_codon:yes gene_type:complete